MWFELHDGVVAHPKTCRAARALGLSRPAVIGHLACLWLWATRYAQDGDISRFDAADIAEAAGFDGDPDAFLDALVTCGPGGSSGYIDQDADGRRLHDWMDHTGRTLATRVADLNRKRQARRPATPAVSPVNTVNNVPAVDGVAVDGAGASSPSPLPPVSPSPAPRASRRPPFTPPTYDEVAAHMLAINEGRFPKPRLRTECQKFLAHYETVGWMAARVPMRDWKAAVVKWLLTAEGDPQRAGSATYDANAEHFRAALEAGND